ncbi:MAG TPA: hypothetical protein VJU77_16835 [Chthoniobacterales bacterium]|nr:hypothetical protein [Chthoniobacterales bacterium]
MLHITLDASTLSKLEPGQTQAGDFTLSLSGVFWQDPSLQPAVPDLTEKHLYPWRWDLPTQVRLFWLNQNGSEVGAPTNLALQAFAAGYQPDTDIIRNHAEQSLGEAIFDQQGHVIPSKILSSMAAQVVEVNDTSDPATIQGYFKGRIAELAQKTPPHNQGLRLVFLASDAGIIIPADATHFVLFPTGGAWWNWTNNRFTDIANHIGYSYADPGAPVGVFRVYCPITIVDRSSGVTNPNSPIRLVHDGAFYGQVRMGAGGVTDTEDWLPGLNYRAAQYLDLPARLLGYLRGAESVLSVTVAQAQEREYVNYLQRIERFLLTVTRDMLGFGRFEEGDGGSLVKRAAAAFAAASGGSEEDQAAVLRTLLAALGAHFPANEPPDLATWRNRLNGAVSSYEETSAVTPDFVALAAVNPSAEALRKALPHWLGAWRIVLQAMQGKDFADRIVLLQWETSGQPAGLDATQWSGVKNALRTLLAELPSSRLLQGDSLITRYRAQLLNIPANVTAEDIPKQIVTNLKLCLQQYAENRRDRVHPVQDLRPSVEVAEPDPFANPPVDMVGAPTWAGFVAFMNNDPLWTDALADLFPGENKVYDIPPPIRVTVDRPGPEDDSSTGDLNDEISGHLVFSRRGVTRGTAAAGQEWRSFNRVKSECRTKDNAGQIVSRPLALPLLPPAFMPEVSGARRCFLTLGNEALSLIAGQREKLENSVDTEPLQPGLSFIFDPTHVAWALLYGYHYEFAGFVALNSGVLSAALRENAAVWNVPRSNFGIVDLAAPENQVGYKHYRRVGVSSVRVVNARDAQGEITNQIAPKEVRSIASELPEWIAGDAIRQEAKSGVVTPDRKWYLLTTQADPTIFRQSAVTVALRKPSTSFWNWYAWAGDTTTAAQKKTAYTRDLLQRDRPFRESKTDAGLLGSALCDPAVEHRLMLLVECLFPVKTKSYYSVPFPDVGDMLLDDPEIQLTVTEAAQANLAVQVAGSAVRVTVPVGQVVRISSHAVLRRDDFTGGQRRFHEWMGITEGNPGGVLELTPDVSSHAQTNDYAITRPIELWFESAQAFPADGTFPEEVWQSLTIRQNGDKVSAGLLRQQGDFARFALIGRIDVHHQVWNWNGRLIDTAQLAEVARDQTQLDPSGGGPRTTLAMKWEAWAFADRPDFARLTKECHLRLWRYDPPTGAAVDKVEDEEELFADHRPKEEKALYYRFSATAYSRYAVLGGAFADPVDTAVVVENEPEVVNPWRRFIRRASRSKPMPKPAIRFILPLTKSFNGTNGHASPDDTAASLLIVLNDRWYTEAGLAEQLEVGVEVLKSPGASQRWYVNAGYDPTLTGEALPGFEYMPVVNARPAGPVGLTFDFAAQTPRLIGSAFILALPNEIPVEGKEPLRLNEALKALFMMRVSVRRKLYPELCEVPLPRQEEDNEENAADARQPLPTLDSPLTAPEWVQFLPSVDFIIPKGWRDQAKCQGHVNLRVADGFINVPNAQRFDRTFEERMERWLVVTQRVYDIGGQPCESYVATLAYRGEAAGAEATELPFTVIDPPSNSNIGSLKDGYVRFILVRKRNDVALDRDRSPWELLFGESGARTREVSPKLTEVENDPGAASPVVSDRLAFRVV